MLKSTPRRVGSEQQAGGFLVSSQRLLDHLGGQNWAWGGLVPPSGIDFCLQPVADDLFVERSLLPTGLKVTGGPEPGRIRGQHFVDDDQFVGRFPSRSSMSELEFGVRENDATFSRVGRGLGVDLQGQIAEFGHQIGANQFAAVSNEMFSS